MGLFADPETEKTGGSNANLVAGIVLLVMGLGFIAWAYLRPVKVPEHVEPVRRRPDPTGAEEEAQTVALTAPGPAGGCHLGSGHG